MGPNGCPETSVRNFDCTVYYPRRAQISRDDLVMQAMVWLRMVQFRAVWLVVVHFGTSYVNLRRPHI